MCTSLFTVLIIYWSMNYTLQHQPTEILNVKPYPDYYHWDLLFFSQRWSVTTCKLYLHNHPERHCYLPSNDQSWIIHGLWPTRLGTIQPSKCNQSWAYDPEQIKSIEGDLDEKWTNIMKEKSDLWQYEWDNHGTCATIIEPLNTQLKYFSKGLELHQRYSIWEMLSQANIVPDDNKEIKIENINNAIKAKLGKQAVIVCQFQAGKQYLVEIHICFDKQLNLVECDGVITIHGMLTTCDVSRDIVYPAKVFASSTVFQNHETHEL